MWTAKTVFGGRQNFRNMFCQFGGLASSPLPLYRPIGLISNGSCSIPTTYADFIFGRNYRRGSVVVAQIDRKQKYGGLLN